MKNFLTSMLLLACICMFGQYTKEDAKTDLKQLKNGVLLVRLHTQQTALEIMEAQGRTKEAEALKEKLYQENKEILLSFSQAFDFCPVYFFYAQDSDHIRDGNFEGVIFDANRLPVDPKEIKSSVYTAEFSETENLGIEGLVVMDAKLFPLESPFPFYQRKYIAFGLISQSKAKMVKQYNDRLHSSYYLWFPEEREEKAKQ